MNTFQNELYLSQSSYLLQHKNNPVAWKIWNSKAFEEARQRNVPVLVSIGYATCHWCHVMAHEVFENTETAALMNESLVCIKVDREENPEVDEIYMEACQSMNGTGGWPLNVFLDHEAKPFLAATYVPLNHWTDLLMKISSAWKNNASELKEYSNELAVALSHDYLSDKLPELSDVNNQLYSYLEKHFDKTNPDFSGDGIAPRFPAHTLYYHLLSKRLLPDKIGVMITDVLTAIQDSGLHDRVGGGFHRYSTDVQWRIPHFEKMLYDNAQLIIAYAMAGNRYDRPDFMQTAKRVANYLMRDMAVYEDGVFKGYASAEDADDPVGEGSYYAWTPTQLCAVLGNETGTKLADDWNITESTTNIHGILPYQIPHPRGADSFRNESPSIQMIKRLEWETVYDVLRQERIKRPRPFCDTKILSDWNALALTGLCILYGTTREDGYRNEAIRIAELLLSRICDGNIERMPGIKGHLTDYGHVALGLFTAWEMVADERFLDASITLVKKAFDEFVSPSGIVYSSIADKNLFMRYEEKSDNTQPAGAHSLLLTWVRLSAHNKLTEYKPLVEKIMERRRKIASQYPVMVPSFLCALWEFDNGPVTLHLPEAFRSDHSAMMHWIGTEVRIVPERDMTMFQVCEKDRCLLPVLSEEELTVQLRFEAV